MVLEIHLTGSPQETRKILETGPSGIEFSYCHTRFISMPIIEFYRTLATSTYTPAIPYVEKQFGVSREVAIIPLSVYAFSMGVGPLFAAPLSELLGRRIIYLLSMPLFLAFTAGAGATQKIQTLIVCRLLAGVLGTTPLAVGAGTISDIWELEKDSGIAGLLFIMAPFLGPYLGAYIIAEYNDDWRYSIWVALMVGAPMFLLSLFMKETLKMKILQTTNQSRDIKTMSPVEQHTLKQVLIIAATRPAHMLFTEPLVFYLSTYTAFGFAMLFSFYSSYSLVFTTVYHEQCWPRIYWHSYGVHFYHHHIRSSRQDGLSKSDESIGGSGCPRAQVEGSEGTKNGNHLLDKTAMQSPYRDLGVQNYHEQKFYEIRDFMLLPREDTEEIRGHLLRAFLDAPCFPPIYEALSYTWGDPNDTVAIKILGSTVPEVSGGSPFEIPDPQKREIGDPMPFSHLGLDALDVIFHQDFEVPLFAAFYTRGKSRLGLLYLMQRSWWQRIWAIQEIAFARKARLLCGDRQHEHGTGLENLLEILQIQSRIMKDPKPSLLDLVELFQTDQCTHRRDRVFAILDLAVEEDSKENLPDYSMALSEFLNFSGGYIEKPGRSPWILEWDSEVTGMSDTASGRLRPRLGFTSLIAQEPYFRQFAASRNIKLEASFRSNAASLCLLSLKAIVVDRINICEEQFKSQRVDDNRVAILWQYYWLDDDPVPLIKKWRELAYEHCAAASSPYGTTEGAVEEAFWRALITDPDPDPSKADKKADFECERGYTLPFRATDPGEHLHESGEYVVLRQGSQENREPPMHNVSVSPQLENDNQLEVVGKWKVLGITYFSNLDGGARMMEHTTTLNDKTTDILGEYPKRLNYFNIGLQNAVFPRRFTITQKGYMGLTPPKAQVGDLICIFFGASTPFVVREIEDGYFRLVGECYVHGLMDGEAMDDLLARKLEGQTITLA
ncbi:hypothetical protein G7Y89_g13865 [Cudoniella acicularis]|uniref:Major facilitator superfamily (MFS) profile domain-containing protein n=1 Tax=Cudoniella acicularis TaxID=354080 RepID=A0A8H4R7F2_9HELO|nr:hypothetical protein G7Y89_g13865 [Cudoniella acicularis]